LSEAVVTGREYDLWVVQPNYARIQTKLDLSTDVRRSRTVHATPWSDLALPCRRATHLRGRVCMPARSARRTKIRLRDAYCTRFYCSRLVPVPARFRVPHRQENGRADTFSSSFPKNVIAQLVRPGEKKEVVIASYLFPCRRSSGSNILSIINCSSSSPPFLHLLSSLPKLSSPAM
jgi:hypothetical protein